jgi:hypothetical protein
MMKLSTQTLLFGGAIALGLMPIDAAQAFTLDLNGTTYELSTITGTFDEVADQLAKQPWWGGQRYLDRSDVIEAASVAEQVGLGLGYTEFDDVTYVEVEGWTQRVDCGQYGGSMCSVLVPAKDSYQLDRFYSFEVENLEKIWCPRNLDLSSNLCNVLFPAKHTYRLGSFFATGFRSSEDFVGVSAEQYAYVTYENRVKCYPDYYFGCEWEAPTVVDRPFMKGVVPFNYYPFYNWHPYFSQKKHSWAIATALNNDDPQPVPEPGMILGYGLLVGLGIHLRRKAA